MKVWKKPSRLAAALALVGAGIVAGFALAAAPAASGTVLQETAQTSIRTAGDMPAMVPQGQFVTVAEQTSPTVVFVEADRPQERAQNGGLDRFFSDFFGNVPRDDDSEGGEDDDQFEHLQTSQGSGVLVSPDGYILTNAHVVAQLNLRTQEQELATAVRVTLQDESSYDAEIVGADLGTDIALIKIDATALPYSRLGDSDEIRVGEWVMAVGAPFGLQNTVSAGIVSALGRATLVGMITPYQDYIQTDAAINPGNSGGPLVNLHGEVIGINTAIATNGGFQPSFAGVGFAVPANLARRVMEQLREHGKVIRGYIGVNVQPLTPDLRDGYGINPNVRGAIITRVIEDGPAEAAGVRVQDIVVGMNGETLRSQQDLLQRISFQMPGDTITLAVLREDRELEIPVTLTERPDEAVILAGQLTSAAPRNDRGEPTGPDSVALRSLGLRVTDLTSRLARQLQLPDGLAGVVITAVAPDSPAARSALEERDVILEVRWTKVTSVAEFEAAMAEFGPGDVVSMHVYDHSTGNQVFVPVRMPR